MIFRVKITTSNFNENQRRKILEAGKLVEECLNTRLFEGFVKGHKVNGQLGFHYTTDSNDTVFNKLISGAETLDNEVDNEADIYVELSYKFTWSTIGYTYPTTKWQWIYNRYFKGASIPAIAGNLAHEWCHKMGYDHEYKWTELREFSVPYSVGYFVEDYAKKATEKSYFERFKAFFS